MGSWPYPARLAAPLFSCLVAFGLRMVFLDQQSLWADEAYSLSLATRASWLGVLEEVLAGDPFTPHTPLYYLLLMPWVQLAGSSDFALRGFSAAFGLLTVPVSYSLAKRLAGQAAGILVAFLAALSPFLVYYSQEARMYAMAGFLAALTAYCFVRSLEDKAWRWWPAYLVSALALVFTLNLGLTLVAALFLVLMLSRPYEREKHLGGVLVHVFVVGGYLVWQGAQNSRFQMVLTPVPAQAFAFLGLDTLKDAVLAFTFGVTLDRAWAVDRVYAFRVNPLQHWSLVLVPFHTTVLAAGSALLALFGTWKLARRRRMAPVFVLLCLIAVVTSVFVLRLTTPGYAVRLTMIVAPLFLLLLVVGLLALPRLLRVTVLVLLVAGMGYSLWQNYFNPAFYRSEFRGLARYLEQEAEPGDGIYLHSPVLRLLQRHYFPEARSVYSIPRSVPVPHNWEEVREQLRSLVQRHPRLWLALGGEGDYDPERRVESWLIENGYQVEDRWFGNSRLSLFISPGSEGKEAFPGRAVGKDLVLLKSSTVLEQAFAPGEGLPLALTWQRLLPSDREYRLSLRLLDSEDRILGQRDLDLGTDLNPVSRWPVGIPVVARTGLRVPVGTPPGPYFLKALVYESSGQPLPQGELGSMPVQIAPGRPGSARRFRPPYRADLRLGALRVMGYHFPQKVWPGQVAFLGIYWMAERTPTEDYSLVVRLGPGLERVLPLLPEYPTSGWREGEALVTRHRVLVPAAASGHPTLSLGLDGETRVGPLALTQVEVANVERNFREPAAQKVYRAGLGGSVELTGVDLDQPASGGAAPVLRPGSSLGLTIYWKGLTEMETSYTVFVQLLDGGGRLVAQDDTLPVGGQRPTTGWLPGEVVRDAHRLGIPAGLPAGRYALIAGMYDAKTGQRLETVGGGLVRLMEVIVRND